MARALYKTAKGYYQGAYRARIREVREWTRGEITSTLAWMWRHVATTAERNECERLRRARSRYYTFAVDDIKIPQDPRAAGDPAPPPPPPPVVAAAVQTGPVAPIRSRAFPHMASQIDITFDLPHFNSNDRNRDRSALLQRSLFAAGLLHLDEDREANRWHGTHILGQGASGIVTHWVAVDEYNNIDERLAVRDTTSVSLGSWISPINWHDQLPREIAILRRLDEQRGYEHNLHRYHGHRIDGHRRRYRIYTEVCEFGRIDVALKHYSHQWWRRYNQYLWLMSHSELQRLKTNDRDLGPDALETSERQLRERLYSRMVDIYRVNPQDPRCENFANLSDTELKECALEDQGHDSLDVIPEAFLWHVFDRLANAALVMHRGGRPFLGEREWREIVHKDLHLGNIFLKPAEESSDGSESGPDRPPKDRNGFVEFPKTQYPQVVVSDFDTAFFDVQHDDQEYQDNPEHYIIFEERGPPDSGCARYPPETTRAFQDRQSAKLTSATDVWGIGQMMWNLAMNIPFKEGLTAPFFEETDEQGDLTYRKLNNGRWYPESDLDDFLLTGNAPFEAAGRYSEELRRMIRRCLRYMPEDRIGIEELKRNTDFGSGLHMAGDDTGDLRVYIDGEMEQFRIGNNYVPEEEREEDWAGWD